MSGAQMAREMAEQPDVLRRIAERAAELRRAVRSIVPDPLAGIVFVARGSSDNAAVLGRYACELAAGRPAGLVAPSVHTRYGAHVDYSGYLAVGLSQSGETPEIVDTCAHLRASGARVIAVTNDPTSRLGETCDLVLATEAGDEIAVPATKTVTAQMALVLVVASALGDALSGLTSLGDLPDAVDALLHDPAPTAELAGRWARFDRLVVAARGLAYAAALETALKVKETSGVHAEAISGFDLLHGPIAAVDGDLPVLCVDGGPPLDGDSRTVLDRAAARGASVATCSPSAASTLPLPGGLPEVLYPLLATVRGQQFAYHLAIARGHDPDSPIGLTKVTPTH